jgi:uncharacterized protein (DUF1015 family)
MATIRSFRALRPAPPLAEKIASVPYDVVSTKEARALASGNDLSFLHVVRPDIDLPDTIDTYDDRVYARAAENFKRLKDSGALIEEESPALYIYRLRMDGRDQIGIAGCCMVDEYLNDTIKKHEFTRKAKEDDRVRHMLTLRAHAGPVLLTYRRTERLAGLLKSGTGTEPLYDFVAEDGVQHTIWRCTDSAAIEEAFKEVPALYIADGHHRAAGASRVAAELKDSGGRDAAAEYNSFLTVVFPSDQLKIFAYNKYLGDLNGKTPEVLLADLEKDFTVEKTDTKDPKSKGSFNMYLAGQWYSLTIRNPDIEPGNPVTELDLYQFQIKLLEPVLRLMDQRKSNRIDFEGGSGSSAKLEERVDHNGGVAFTFRPVSVEELMRVSDAAMVMPPKSTWFAPKLRSGLLIHQF